MKIRSRITEMLGVDYPILMGGIKALGNHELASAVSNAGGFGMVTAQNFLDADSLKREIKLTKSLTNKPFGVNISILPGDDWTERIDAWVKTVIEEEIPAVETSGGMGPERIVQKLKNHGIKVIHKVSTVRYALKAAKAGVDAVTVIGYESGGHLGMDQVAGQILLQKACQQLDIPILFAAGVVDGKGLVSALALGAEGVVLGSRFVLSRESPLHQNMKELLLKSQETDTVVTQRSIRNTLRAVKNNHALKVLGFETSFPTLQQLMPLISGAASDEAVMRGDVQNCLFSIGECVGLMNDIPTIQEIVDRIIATAEDAIRRINSMIQC